MSARHTLALVTVDRLDERATEFLRICVGCLAGGHEVVLRDLGGSGRSIPERAPVSSAAWVDALVDAGVLSRDGAAGEAGGLRDALRICRGVLRLGDGARSGVPALLVIDDAYLAAITDEQLATDLANAGQVIRC